MFPDMSKVINEKPKNFVKIIMERFPEKIKFGKSVTSIDGKVSMVAEVQVGAKVEKFRGIGRNKKLAKLASAKCAIRELKKKGNF